MISSRLLECRQEAGPSFSEGGKWQELTLSCTQEVPEGIEAVLAAMTLWNYSKKDLFAVRLALEEAVMNGLKHGNREDPAKKVRIRYHLSEKRIVLEVEDEGEGFDPTTIPDPLDPVNRDRIGGRGLLLIRAYMTSVCHNSRGNCIAMTRLRGWG
jgi:serine/threonine-protein kinase RsbW